MSVEDDYKVNMVKKATTCIRAIYCVLEMQIIYTFIMHLNLLKDRQMTRYEYKNTSTCILNMYVGFFFYIIQEGLSK